jgi:hypothetical protein
MVVYFRWSVKNYFRGPSVYAILDENDSRQFSLCEEFAQRRGRQDPAGAEARRDYWSESA